MRTPAPAWRSLPASRRALAGIEFALILPLMLTLLAGLVDLSLGIITARRLGTAALDVSVIASTLAVQPNAPNTLTGQQAYAATTAPFAIFPNWHATGAPPFFATLTEVEFTGVPQGCSTNCTSYVPLTRWSVNNPQGTLFLRPCGTLLIVPNGSGWNPLAIPQGAVSATSELLSDVFTVFTPPLTASFIGTFPLYRSAYVPPRVKNTVALSGGGPANTVVCP